MLPYSSPASNMKYNIETIEAIFSDFHHAGSVLHQSETERLPCPIFCLNLGTFPSYVLPVFVIILVISGADGS